MTETRSRISRPINTLNEDDCRDFRTNPTVNPLSRRTINPNTRNGVYDMLKKECDDKFPENREIRQTTATNQETPTIQQTPSRISSRISKKLESISFAKCQEWIENPTVNPLTGKNIDPNTQGGIYTILSQICFNKYGLRPTGERQSIRQNIPKRVGSIQVPRTEEDWRIFFMYVNEYYRDYHDFQFIYKNHQVEYNNRLKILDYHPEPTKREVVEAKEKLEVLRLKPVETPLPEYDFSNHQILDKLDDIRKFVSHILLHGEAPTQDVIYSFIKYIQHAKYQHRSGPIDRISLYVADLIMANNELALVPEEESKGSLPKSKSLDLSAISSLSSENSSRSRKYKSSYKSHKALSYVSPVAEHLEKLPIKTRQVLLQELKEMCTEMRDTITFERFDRMKKKHLQLVVKLGKEGERKRCYYVRSIYDQWRHANAENKPFVDPLTRKSVTPEERETIMKLIKYIVPDAKDLRDTKNKNQKVTLKFTEHIERYNGINVSFYKIAFERKFSQRLTWTFLDSGYIPADLDPEDFNGPRSLDHSSAVLVTKLNELQKQGRLLINNNMPYRCCRIHLNKPISYWLDEDHPKGIATRKVVSMLEEINSLL